MDIRSIWTRGTMALALAATVAVVAGCGDNEAAGSKEGFRIIPSEISYTGAPGSCPGDGTAAPNKDRVYVYGGAGPYQISNTAPGTLSVSSTSVSGPGGYFEVAPRGTGCPFSVQVIVTDELGKTVTLTVNGAQGS